MLEMRYSWLILRHTSRVFHALMADGTYHAFEEIYVRVNEVEKLLIFQRGYPEISLTNGGNKSTIDDETTR